MAEITFKNGTKKNIAEIFDLTEKKIKAIDGANTIDELTAVLTDVKIGIDLLQNASVSNTVCHAAITVMIDALKDALVKATATIDAKIKPLLEAEAKLSAKDLLDQAEKWMRWGYDNLARSFLRTYSLFKSEFSLEDDQRYADLRIKCKA